MSTNTRDHAMQGFLTIVLIEWQETLHVYVKKKRNTPRLPPNHALICLIYKCEMNDLILKIELDKQKLSA
jgi:hypothetical protein